MELSHYLTTLCRRWFVPLAFVIIAITGVFVLNRSTRVETAQATVSVLDAFLAAPGTYTQAQVPFDAIIKSDQLATRGASCLPARPRRTDGRDFKLRLQYRRTAAGWPISPTSPDSQRFT